MKVFFTELFQYNTYVNQEVIAACIKHPDRVSEKCKSLLSHMLNVHQLWNGKIMKDLEPFQSWAIRPIQDCPALDNENTALSMRILDQFPVDQVIEYATSKGHVYHHSVRDILFHVINHSTYHRAQIATEFRQGGLEPLLTDYIYYKMKSLPSSV